MCDNERKEDKLNDLGVTAIAVGGTLLGVLITGVFSVVATASSAKAQREDSVRQLAHMSMEANRVERRKVYAEFIDCLERWRFLSHDVGWFHAGLVPPPGAVLDKQGRFHWTPEAIDEDDENKRPALELEKRRDDLWDRWREAFGRLQLLASDQVSERASKVFYRYSRKMEDAWAGDISPEFDEESPTSDDLIGSMRADVGVDALTKPSGN
jgi:hypothetical protein